MSFFSIFKSSLDTTKSNLEQIQAYEVQNRIEGNRDVYQHGNVINNYFYDTKKKKSYNPDNEEQYDYSDDITVYNDLPESEREIYGSYDNWVSGDVGKDYFMDNPELIAEYGSYKNMQKGVTVEDKIQKSLSYKILGRIPNSIKKEATVANQARSILHERQNAQLLADTERFKRKTEKQMKHEAEMANKRSDVANLAKEMKAFNDNVRIQNQQQKEQISVIDEIARLRDLVINATSQPQISAKSVANELMQSFRSNQRQRASIIDTKILTR